MAARNRKTLKKSLLRFVGKNDPLREVFPNSVPKGFIAAPIDVLCSNFAKFGRREIGKIMRCLCEFSLALQLSLLRGSRPKSARPDPENVLTMLQISSKSVHFQRSYIRTPEHRQIELESQSKPIFEPNNYWTYQNYYTPCLKKRPTFDLLQSLHTRFDCDNFW